MSDEELIVSAKKACENAYAPYSEFPVGAALLAKDDKVYTGANVENASYGLTICAERNALGHAVASGCRSFGKIVIFSKCSPPATPCGACRQALFEFAPNLQVICANDKGELSRFTLNQLLPECFRPAEK